MAQGAVTLVKNDLGLLPLAEGTKVCSLVLDDDDDLDAQAGWRAALADHPDVLVRVLTNAEDEAAIAEAVSQAAGSGCDTVLVPIFMSVRAWKNRVELPELLGSVPERLVAAGLKVVVLSFTSPFLLRSCPNVAAYVCAYSAHPMSQRAAVRSLWGQAGFPGRLPVDPDQLEAPAAR